MKNFDVEKRENKYAITYTDPLVPKYDFLLVDDIIEAKKLKGLFSLAYTLGSSNTLEIFR